MKILVIPVTPFAQNATIFACPETREAVVIDPGGDVELIEAAIAKHQLVLRYILLTHGHLDHVGGTAELKQRYDVPVWGPHRDDEFLIQSLAVQAQMFGFPQVDDFTPDRWLVSGDEIQFGELTLQTLHCPGHTPGHLVFYQAEQGVLQVGDVLFKNSIGRTDFPRGNHAQLLTSIRENLLSLPDDTVFIPGHGPQSTIGDEKRFNPYLK